MKQSRNGNEASVIHRTRCVVSEVTRELAMLGFHQAAPDGSGGFKAQELDPAQRRNLLVFLSELEELTKTLDVFQANLARDIEAVNRNVSAAATYRRTGLSVRKHLQHGGH